MNGVDEGRAASLRAVLEQEAGRTDSLFFDLPARYGFCAIGHRLLVISVEDRKTRVEEGEGAGPTECVLIGDEDTLVDVLKGRQHLGNALLQGRVDVRGDLSLVAYLNSALRAAFERRKSAT